MCKKQKTPQYIGTVITYNSLQGTGTIETSDGSHIFFTYKQLPVINGKFLRVSEGQRISFDIQQDSFLGKIAVNIKPLTQKQQNNA